MKVEWLLKLIGLKAYSETFSNHQMLSKVQSKNFHVGLICRSLFTSKFVGASLHAISFSQWMKSD
ncbi:MAG: hypothetical protein RMK94_17015 [Armatimonadota bacterium]|nr:hypothetical protein [Armatimonadota bacterium]